MKLTEKPLLNNALLISICTPQFKGEEAKQSLAELTRLVTTLGFKVVGTQSQKQNLYAKDECARCWEIGRDRTHHR